MAQVEGDHSEAVASTNHQLSPKKTSKLVRFYKLPTSASQPSTGVKIPLTSSSKATTTSSTSPYCPNVAIKERHAHALSLSKNFSREQCLQNRNRPIIRHQCSLSFPDPPAIRTSDATGLDPNSALAKRRVYATLPMGKSDALCQESRDYFLHKSQSYTWTRARLMRDIKGYLTADVPMSPKYKSFWCNDIELYLQNK